MRKLVVYNSITLDGYYAGPDGEIDWMMHDPEVEQAAHGRMNPDTVLFGRETYQMFESFWPQMADNPNAPEGARNMARELNGMTKLVCSSTLTETNWINSRLIRGMLAEEAAKLKQGDGPDITIFGSGSVVRQLAEAGLIDEFLLVVTPVAIGAGRTLFEQVKRCSFKLLYSQSFRSGIVLLHYAVE